MMARRTGLTHTAPHLQLASAAALSNANLSSSNSEAAGEGVEEPGDSSCVPCGTSSQKALPLKIKLEGKLLLPPVLFGEDFRSHPPNGSNPNCGDGHAAHPITGLKNRLLQHPQPLNPRVLSACTFLDFTTRSK